MNNFESFGHVIMTMLSKHGDFIHVDWIRDNVPIEHQKAFVEYIKELAKKNGKTLIVGSEHIYCFGGDFDGRL